MDWGLCRSMAAAEFAGQCAGGSLPAKKPGARLTSRDEAHDTARAPAGFWVACPVFSRLLVARMAPSHVGGRLPASLYLF